MTNKELQEYLKQFPDDAIMECLEEDTSGYYSYTKYVDMNIDNLEDLDFRLIENVSNVLKDKVFIRIGGLK
jgi:hypothetical protein